MSDNDLFYKNTKTVVWGLVVFFIAAMGSCNVGNYISLKSPKLQTTTTVTVLPSVTAN